MAYLVVGNDLSLFLTQDAVLLLFSDEDNLDCLEKILLGNGFSSVLDRKNRCLVDHICKIRTNGSRCRKCNAVEINRLIERYVLGMYFQDFHTAFQVRSFYDNPAVKTARTQQRRVKHLRAVCRRKDQNTLGAVKSVHLGKELV